MKKKQIKEDSSFLARIKQAHDNDVLEKQKEEKIKRLTQTNLMAQLEDLRPEIYDLLRVAGALRQYDYNYNTDLRNYFNLDEKLTFSTYEGDKNELKLKYYRNTSQNCTFKYLYDRDSLMLISDYDEYAYKRFTEDFPTFKQKFLTDVDIFLKTKNA